MQRSERRRGVARLALKMQEGQPVCKLKGFWSHPMAWCHRLRLRLPLPLEGSTEHPRGSASRGEYSPTPLECRDVGRRG